MNYGGGEFPPRRWRCAWSTKSEHGGCPMRC